MITRPTSDIDIAPLAIPMAKFGSFFRRLFTSLISEDHDSDPFPASHPRKSIVIISPSTPPLPASVARTTLPPVTSRSCSASPRLPYRTMTKQTTLGADSDPRVDHVNKPVLPKTHNVINRRLSAPLIIHTGPHHPRQCSTTIVDECDEDALISPLQRLSLSSATGSSPAYHSYTINSLGTSAADSPRADLYLSSSNSINLPSSLNTISPASGRCFVVAQLSMTREKRAARLFVTRINNRDKGGVREKRSILIHY